MDQFPKLSPEEILAKIHLGGLDQCLRMRASSKWYSCVHAAYSKTSIIRSGFQRLKKIYVVQVNIFQKLSFLNQLTHNMRLFIEFPEKYKFTLCCVQKLFLFCFDIQNNICTQHVVNQYLSGNSINNLSSYCGSTDSRMRASEKYLPVINVNPNFRSTLWYQTRNRQHLAPDHVTIRKQCAANIHASQLVSPDLFCNHIQITCDNT